MDHQIKECQQIGVSDLLKQNQEIVISGIGGRFPLSNNTDEFASNLFNNIDMITEDENNERWSKSKSLKYFFLILKYHQNY